MLVPILIISQDIFFYECRNDRDTLIELYYHDNLSIDDQTGTFSYKFTQYPSTDLYFHQFPYLALMHMFQYLPQTSEME